MEENKTVTFEHNFSDREIAGLQYLGGYCLHNLNKKLKRSDKVESIEIQESISLLNASRCDTEAQENQRLIAAINRDGLWGVRTALLEILKVTEKEFLHVAHK